MRGGRGRTLELCPGNLLYYLCFEEDLILLLLRRVGYLDA